MKKISGLKKISGNFSSTNCYTYLTSRILSASKGGNYYGLPDDLTNAAQQQLTYEQAQKYCTSLMSHAGYSGESPASAAEPIRINQRAGLYQLGHNSMRCHKDCNELNNTLWDASRKSSIYVPDTATSWYESQKQPSLAERCRMMEISGTRSGPISSHLRIENPIRRAVQNRFNPDRFKRISPEFLELLQKHDETMMLTNPLYGISPHYLRRSRHNSSQSKQKPHHEGRRAASQSAVGQQKKKPNESRIDDLARGTTILYKNKHQQRFHSKIKGNMRSKSEGSCVSRIQGGNSNDLDERRTMWEVGRNHVEGNFGHYLQGNNLTTDNIEVNMKSKLQGSNKRHTLGERNMQNNIDYNERNLKFEGGNMKMRIEDHSMSNIKSLQDNRRSNSLGSRDTSSEGSGDRKRNNNEGRRKNTHEHNSERRHRYVIEKSLGRESESSNIRKTQDNNEDSENQRRNKIKSRWKNYLKARGNRRSNSEYSHRNLIDDSLKNKSEGNIGKTQSKKRSNSENYKSNKAESRWNSRVESNKRRNSERNYGFLSGCFLGNERESSNSRRNKNVSRWNNRLEDNKSGNSERSRSNIRKKQSNMRSNSEERTRNKIKTRRDSTFECNSNKNEHNVASEGESYNIRKIRGKRRSHRGDSEDSQDSINEIIARLSENRSDDINRRNRNKSLCCIRYGRNGRTRKRRSQSEDCRKQMAVSRWYRRVESNRQGNSEHDNKCDGKNRRSKSEGSKTSKSEGSKTSISEDGWMRKLQKRCRLKFASSCFNKLRAARSSSSLKNLQECLSAESLKKLKKCISARSFRKLKASMNGRGSRKFKEIISSKSLRNLKDCMSSTSLRKIKTNIKSKLEATEARYKCEDIKSKSSKSEVKSRSSKSEDKSRSSKSEDKRRSSKSQDRIKSHKRKDSKCIRRWRAQKLQLYNLCKLPRHHQVNCCQKLFALWAKRDKTRIGDSDLEEQLKQLQDYAQTEPRPSQIKYHTTCDDIIRKRQEEEELRQQIFPTTQPRRHVISHKSAHIDPELDELKKRRLKYFYSETRPRHARHRLSKIDILKPVVTEDEMLCKRKLVHYKLYSEATPRTHQFKMPNLSEKILDCYPNVEPRANAHKTHKVCNTNLDEIAQGSYPNMKPEYGYSPAVYNLTLNDKPQKIEKCTCSHAETDGSANPPNSINDGTKGPNRVNTHEQQPKMLEDRSRKLDQQQKQKKQKKKHKLYCLPPYCQDEPRTLEDGDRNSARKSRRIREYDPQTEPRARPPNIYKNEDKKLLLKSSTHAYYPRMEPTAHINGMAKRCEGKCVKIQKFYPQMQPRAHSLTKQRDTTKHSDEDEATRLREYYKSMQLRAQAPKEDDKPLLNKKLMNQMAQLKKHFPRVQPRAHLHTMPNATEEKPEMHRYYPRMQPRVHATRSPENMGNIRKKQSIQSQSYFPRLQPRVYQFRKPRDLNRKCHEGPEDQNEKVREHTRKVQRYYPRLDPRVRSLSLLKDTDEDETTKIHKSYPRVDPRVHVYSKDTDEHEKSEPCPRLRRISRDKDEKARKDHSINRTEVEQCCCHLPHMQKDKNVANSTTRDKEEKARKDHSINRTEVEQCCCHSPHMHKDKNVANSTTRDKEEKARKDHSINRTDVEQCCCHSPHMHKDKNVANSTIKEHECCRRVEPRLHPQAPKVQKTYPRMDLRSRPFCMCRDRNDKVARRIKTVNEYYPRMEPRLHSPHKHTDINDKMPNDNTKIKERYPSTEPHLHSSHVFTDTDDNVVEDTTKVQEPYPSIERLHLSHKPSDTDIDSKVQEDTIVVQEHYPKMKPRLHLQDKSTDSDKVVKDTIKVQEPYPRMEPRLHSSHKFTNTSTDGKVQEDTILVQEHYPRMEPSTHSCRKPTCSKVQEETTKVQEPYPRMEPRSHKPCISKDSKGKCYCCVVSTTKTQQTYPRMERRSHSQHKPIDMDGKVMENTLKVQERFPSMERRSHQPDMSTKSGGKCSCRLAQITKAQQSYPRMEPRSHSQHKPMDMDEKEMENTLKVQEHFSKTEPPSHKRSISKGSGRKCTCSVAQQSCPRMQLCVHSPRQLTDMDGKVQEDITKVQERYQITEPSSHIPSMSKDSGRRLSFSVEHTTTAQKTCPRMQPSAHSPRQPTDTDGKVQEDTTKVQERYQRTEPSSHIRRLSGAGTLMDQTPIEECYPRLEAQSYPIGIPNHRDRKAMKQTMKIQEDYLRLEPLSEPLRIFKNMYKKAVKQTRKVQKEYQGTKPRAYSPHMFKCRNAKGVAYTTNLHERYSRKESSSHLPRTSGAMDQTPARECNSKFDTRSDHSRIAKEIVAHAVRQTTKVQELNGSIESRTHPSTIFKGIDANVEQMIKVPKVPGAGSVVDQTPIQYATRHLEDIEENVVKQTKTIHQRYPRMEPHVHPPKIPKYIDKKAVEQTTKMQEGHQAKIYQEYPEIDPRANHRAFKDMAENVIEQMTKVQDYYPKMKTETKVDQKTIKECNIRIDTGKHTARMSKDIDANVVEQITKIQQGYPSVKPRPHPPRIPKDMDGKDVQQTTKTRDSYSALEPPMIFTDLDANVAEQMTTVNGHYPKIELDIHLQRISGAGSVINQPLIQECYPRIEPQSHPQSISKNMDEKTTTLMMKTQEEYPSMKPRSHPSKISKDINGTEIQQTGKEREGYQGMKLCSHLSRMQRTGTMVYQTPTQERNSRIESRLNPPMIPKDIDAKVAGKTKKTHQGYSRMEPISPLPMIPQYIDTNGVKKTVNLQQGYPRTKPKFQPPGIPKDMDEKVHDRYPRMDPYAHETCLLYDGDVNVNDIQKTAMAQEVYPRMDPRTHQPWIPKDMDGNLWKHKGTGSSKAREGYPRIEPSVHLPKIPKGRDGKVLEQTKKVREGYPSLGSRTHLFEVPRNQNGKESKEETIGSVQYFAKSRHCADSPQSPKGWDRRKPRNGQYYPRMEPLADSSNTASNRCYFYDMNARIAGYSSSIEDVNKYNDRIRGGRENKNLREIEDPNEEMKRKKCRSFSFKQMLLSSSCQSKKKDTDKMTQKHGKDNTDKNVKWGFGRHSRSGKKKSKTLLKSSSSSSYYSSNNRLVTRKRSDTKRKPRYISTQSSEEESRDATSKPTAISMKRRRRSFESPSAYSSSENHVPSRRRAPVQDSSNTSFTDASKKKDRLRTQNYTSSYSTSSSFYSDERQILKPRDRSYSPKAKKRNQYLTSESSSPISLKYSNEKQREQTHVRQKRSTSVRSQSLSRRDQHASASAFKSTCFSSKQKHATMDEPEYRLGDKPLGNPRNKERSPSKHRQLVHKKCACDRSQSESKRLPPSLKKIHTIQSKTKIELHRQLVYRKYKAQQCIHHKEPHYNTPKSSQTSFKYGPSYKKPTTRQQSKKIRHRQEDAQKDEEKASSHRTNKKSDKHIFKMCNICSSKSSSPTPSTYKQEETARSVCKHSSRKRRSQSPSSHRENSKKCKTCSLSNCPFHSSDGNLKREKHIRQTARSVSRYPGNRCNSVPARREPSRPPSPRRNVKKSNSPSSSASNLKKEKLVRQTVRSNSRHPGCRCKSAPARQQDVKNKHPLPPPQETTTITEQFLSLFSCKPTNPPQKKKDPTKLRESTKKKNRKDILTTLHCFPAPYHQIPVAPEEEEITKKQLKSSTCKTQTKPICKTPLYVENQKSTRPTNTPSTSSLEDLIDQLSRQVAERRRCPQPKGKPKILTDAYGDSEPKKLKPRKSPSLMAKAFAKHVPMEPAPEPVIYKPIYRFGQMPSPTVPKIPKRCIQVKRTTQREFIPDFILGENTTNYAPQPYLPRIKVTTTEQLVGLENAPRKEVSYGHGITCRRYT